MPLIHKQGSLFHAPAGGVLVHSCNALGIWGGGPQSVATQMLLHAPSAFELYKSTCQRHGMRALAAVAWEKPRQQFIASLIVSNQVGFKKGPARVILSRTREAIEWLLDPVHWPNMQRPSEWHSPRLNSGLFGVPWEETEERLRHLVTLWNVNWTVWTP